MIAQHRRLLAAAVVLVAACLPLRAAIPGASLTRVSHSPQIYPRVLAAGPDGRIWFADERFTPHSIGFFTLPDGVPTVFPIPCDECATHTKMAYIESIAVGPDGNLWFLWTHVASDGSPLNGGMNSFVGRVTPAGVFTMFPVATKDAFRRYIFASQGNSMIAAGPDGNLWFTENTAYKIGRITPAGVITEYPLASFSWPSGIVAGPDGNIWFAEMGEGKIGRITPAGAITEFSIPGDAAPYDVTAGADHNLWFTDWRGRIGRITPAGAVTLFALEANSVPNQIASGDDGNLYFPYITRTSANPAGYEGKVAQLDLATAGSESIHIATTTVTTESLPSGYGFDVVPVARDQAAAALIFSVAEPREDGQTQDADYLLRVQNVPCPAPADFKPDYPDLYAFLDEPFRVVFTNSLATSSDRFKVLANVPGLSTVDTPATGGGTGFGVLLSGDPRQTGNFEVFVRRDPYDPRPQCQQEKKYVLHVRKRDCPPLQLTPTGFPPATMGQPYEFTFTVRPHVLIRTGQSRWVQTKADIVDQNLMTVTVTGTPNVEEGVILELEPDLAGCEDELTYQLIRVYPAHSLAETELFTLPVVQSGTEFRVSFGAPGASMYRFAESMSADMSNATTNDTGEQFHVITKTVAQPTSFFFQATALDGPAANMPSAIGRTVVQPVPSPASPGAAKYEYGSFEVPSQLDVFRTRLTTAQSVRASEATFTATVDNAIFIVSPSSGTIPSSGLELVVRAETFHLPVGTTSGTLRITLNEGGKSSTLSYPVSISIVTPVAAQPRYNTSADAYIVPAVAHARGANASEFRSDLRVSNLGSKTAQYRFTFTPSGSDGTRTGSSFVMLIRAGQTIALDDVLLNFFGAGAAGEAAAGALEIRPETPGATALVASRTYNFTASGTLGQFIPAVPISRFSGRGTIQSLQQVADSDAYRTNIGLVEGSGEPATLAVRILDGSGTLQKTVSVSLAPAQHVQLNGFLGNNGVKLDDARVEVEVTSAKGQVTSYASVIDNRTNDPLLVSPVIGASDALARSVQPGVADLNNGAANFHTDMRIFNPSSNTANVTLMYSPQGAPASGVTKNVSVPKKSVRVLDDVLPSFFGLHDTGGAVLVTTSTSTPVIVTGRTYSRASSGTYGQFIPAVGTTSAAARNGKKLQLTQLEDSAAFRTNIGLFEVGGSGAHVRLTTTVPGEATANVVELDLQPNEFRQLGGFLRGLGLGNVVYNARVTIEVTSGSGKVGAYASIVDNFTQDPTYVPAQ